MPRLRYSLESKEDLRQIARYIAQNNPTAARRWVAKIKAKCRLIASNPGIGDDRSELGKSVRSSCLRSYVIFFRSTERAVEIVRVIRGDCDTQSL